MQKQRRPNRQPRRGGGNNFNPPNSGSSSNSRQQSNSSRQSKPPRSYTPVPAYSSIVIGRGVSIVLKQDQPTGHQVTGIVAEFLTRGDHPRGVKVRLRDGRVGRVQRLVSDSEGEQGENLVGGAEAGLGRNGEASAGVNSSAAQGRGGFRHVKDIREDDEYLYDENQTEMRETGYFAALEEADKKHEEQRAWGGQAGERPSLWSEEGGELAICPVCGVFEGDEMAVAHHVEGHFAGDE